MKPIIKWVGGKTQLLPDILRLTPVEYARYLEPFLGGAAALLALTPKDAVVNDLNSELTNTYNVVKYYPQALMDRLDRHEKGHSEDYYYQIRELDRLVGLENLNHIYRASRFVYLNKAGFNGLYRVNSQGYMNVPFGKKKEISLYDADNIKKVHKFLKGNNVKMCNMDYYDFILKHVEEGDFVYMDPPYHPISETSAFTSYQKEGFDAKEQEKLRDVCVEIDRRGAKFILSNSNSDFIKEIYSGYGFILTEVYARRNINSKGNARGPIKEILIRNNYRTRGDNDDGKHF